MAGPDDGGKRRDKEEHYRRAAFMHPLRHRIMRLVDDGEEVGVSEIAAALDEPPGRIAYHVRLLLRRDALKAVPRCRPAQALYRWSPQADWARKMLGELDQLDLEEG